MVSAPKPGVGRRLAISDQLASAGEDWRRVVCTRDDKDVVVYASSIGPEDERSVQQQAGVTVWEAWSPDSLTKIAALYWFARWKNGERSLTFRDVVRTLKDTTAFKDAGIEIWVSEDAEDDGGAADPAVDPTPSATGSEPGGPPSPSGTESTPGT